MEDTPVPASTDITLADLINVVKIIDVVAGRGGFRGEELGSVGSVRDKISAFIETARPPEEGDENPLPANQAPEETPAVEKPKTKNSASRTKA
jgi:hypothetical protein